MQVTLADRAQVTGVRKTRDGYLVAEARIARTGIQTYTAGELGLKDRAPGDVIRVYRPADEVFSADAMASLAHRPITIDHPSERVTADNWKRHSVGNTGGEVMRDGDFVKVPLVLMDAAAISAVESGKRQLSVGYGCTLDLTPGITDAGEPYDAAQRGITGNHLAICDVARGGPQLRIGDKETTVTTKTILFDGLPVEVTDAAETVIGKLQGQIAALTARVSDAETKLGAAVADADAKAGQVAALEQQLADASDPVKLNAKVQARAALVSDAKRIAPQAAISDAASDAEIRRAAVAARLGDKAKDMSDAAIEGAFAALAPAGGADPLRAAIGDAATVPAIGDARARADAARAARLKEMTGAWKGQAA
jgi:hypothetical protein